MITLRTRKLAASSVLLLVLWSIATLSPAAVHPRVALIVGNSQYQSLRPLGNPHNDAQAMADKLRSLGFTLLGISGRPSEAPLLDLTEAEFQRAVRAFARAARGSEIAFVYYAGHGLQIGSESYLLPVDVPAGNTAMIQRNAMGLESLLHLLDDAAELTLAVFDACREIPDLQQHSGGGVSGDAYRGLGRVMSKGRNRIVAFSSAAGQLVEDGLDAPHSPYTSELLGYLDRPGLEVGDLFRQVAFHFAQTRGGQEPEVLIQGVPPQRYYLATTLPGAEPPRVAAVNGNDEAFWTTTELCGNARCYDAYLAAYPRGAHAAEARERLNRLTRSIGVVRPSEGESAEPPAAPPPPPPTSPVAPPPPPAQARGFLQVIANVAAEISVDGQRLGTVLPNRPLNVSDGLPVGATQVQAAVPGQSPQSQDTVIKANAWSTVVFRFTETAPPPPPAPTAPPPPPPLAATGLTEQLNACRDLLEANKLSVGDPNAISCYREILAAHPGNPQALRGLTDIEDRYRDLAISAIQRGRVDDAATYIDRLAELNPSYPSLGSLRGDLERGRETAREVEARRAAAREAERRRQEELERQIAEEERLRQEEEARQSITQCLDQARLTKTLCEEREQRKVAECKSDKREEAYIKFQADVLTEYPEKLSRYERCVSDYRRQRQEIKDAMATAVMEHQVIPEAMDPKAKQTLHDLCGDKPEKPKLESYLDLSSCVPGNTCDREYQRQVDYCSGRR